MFWTLLGTRNGEKMTFTNDFRRSLSREIDFRTRPLIACVLINY